MPEGRIDELRRRIAGEPRLFAQLAEEHRRAGEYDEAIRVARAGLRHHPAYAAAQVTLGRALLERGDAGAACGVLEEASRRDPENILAARFYGLALSRAGDLQRALAQLEATLRLVPGDQEIAAEVEAVRRRAAGDAGLGFGVRAEPRRGEGKSGAREVPSRETAGREHAGREGERLQPPDLVKAVALEAAPEVDAGGEVAARVRARGGLGGGGLAEPETAQAEGECVVPRGSRGLDRDGPPLWSSTLGELYLKQGFPERAIEVYRQVVRQSPGNVRARQRLAEIEGLGGVGGLAAEQGGERRRGLERAIAGLEVFLRAARRR